MTSRWTEEDLQRHTGKLKLKAEPVGKTGFRVGWVAVPDPPQRSKYRNVKVRVEGLLFDSKHEAQFWQECRLREKAGEITELRRQVPFDLLTVEKQTGLHLVVATYIADMTFYENGALVVADAKGHLTKEFRLKRKWLELQSGIIIREVYKR